MTGVAVVTGAAGGLGGGIVVALRRAGYRVIPVDRVAMSDEDGRVFDVTEPGAADRVLAEIAREAGALDVLVTCHGVLQSLVDVTEIDDNELRRVMAINFEGTFRCCRAAARIMRAQGRGRIVTVASQAGKVPWPQAAVYGASKAAVIALTQGLATELGPHGVTVNAVCPGVMRTEMTVGAFGGGTEDPSAVEAALAAKAASLPVGRLGTPEDVGAAVTWLASPAAGFVTGTALNVTGGEQFF